MAPVMYRNEENGRIFYRPMPVPALEADDRYTRVAPEPAPEHDEAEHEEPANENDAGDEPEDETAEDDEPADEDEAEHDEADDTEEE